MPAPVLPAGIAAQPSSLLTCFATPTPAPSEPWLPLQVTALAARLAAEQRREEMILTGHLSSQLGGPCCPPGICHRSLVWGCFGRVLKPRLESECYRVLAPLGVSAAQPSSPGHLCEGGWGLERQWRGSCIPDPKLSYRAQWGCPAHSHLTTGMPLAATFVHVFLFSSPERSHELVCWWFFFNRKKIKLEI